MPIQCLVVCRYQYTLQPTTSLVCNPYLNQRLIIDCQMTYSTSEQSVILQWVFVPDTAGSARTLSTDGIKYSISASPLTGRTRSTLTVSALGDSDVGRYYCQAGFNNGTRMSRSEELTLFSQAVFRAQPGLASCSTFSGQSDLRTTCALQAGQVAVGTSNPDQNGGTNPNNNNGGLNNGGGSGSGGLPGDQIQVIVIAVVICAVVVFILLAVGLVTCLLLCNCLCESVNYGVDSKK